MKTNKFLVMAAMALGLGVFAACSNDDEPNVSESKGNTYVGVTISFPGMQTRASLPEDYHSKGKWEGRDKIEQITVFMVNKENNVVDYTSFDESAFEEINGGILKPTLAVKATKGHKVKSFVVINDKKDIITSKLKKTSATNFETEFAEAKKAIASEVATTNELKDIILMTNNEAPTELTVEQAKKSEAIDGTKNQCKVSVERIVARGILTMSKDILTKKVLVKKQGTNKVVSEVNITEVKYGIGQGNTKFFIMKKNTYETPDPVYTYNPATSSDWKDKNTTYFDYKGLELSNFSEVQAIDNNTIENVKNALNKEDKSKFALPVTHTDDNYKKGNTTFFEVQVKFTPTDESFAVGEKEKLNGSTTYYLGMNDGKFYQSRAAAAAVGGQKVTEYKNGTMKYVLWLNPDKVPGAEEGKIAKVSPTVRNQVYHAHIKGFKEIGLPNNPLNPDDPNNNENPENPINPNDPLETESTYLSVSITVLEWGMHSYEVDLGNDY